MDGVSKRRENRINGVALDVQGMAIRQSAYETESDSSSTSRSSNWSNSPKNYNWRISHELTGHEAGVHSLVYSPDGKQIASSCRENAIKLWDPTTGELVHKIPTGRSQKLTTLVYSPDGSRILSASSDETIQLWNPATRMLLHSLKGCVGESRTVAYSPSSNQIAYTTIDSTIRLSSPISGATMAEIRDVPVHDINDLIYSLDGRKIATASRNMTISIWDAVAGTLSDTMGRERKTGLWTGLKTVQFLRDGVHVVSASFDGNVRLWDSKTGRVERTLRKKIKETQPSVKAPLVCSPVSDQVAYAPNENIIVWHSSHLSAVGKELKGHRSNIMCLAFSPDGTRLISGSGDSTVKVWDPNSNAPITTLLGHSRSVMHIAFSPDGNQIASGSHDGKIVLWDQATEHETDLENMVPESGHVESEKTSKSKAKFEEVPGFTGAKERVEIKPLVSGKSKEEKAPRLESKPYPERHNFQGGHGAEEEITKSASASESDQGRDDIVIREIPDGLSSRPVVVKPRNGPRLEPLVADISDVEDTPPASARRFEDSSDSEDLSSASIRARKYFAAKQRMEQKRPWTSRLKHVADPALVALGLKRRSRSRRATNGGNLSSSSLEVEVDTQADRSPTRGALTERAAAAAAAWSSYQRPRRGSRPEMRFL